MSQKFKNLVKNCKKLTFYTLGQALYSDKFGPSSSRLPVRPYPWTGLCMPFQFRD